VRTLRERREIIVRSAREFSAMHGVVKEIRRTRAIRIQSYIGADIDALLEPRHDTQLRAA
jgi:hypothetical protein